MIRCLLKVNGVTSVVWARSTIDAINMVREQVGFGPTISARAAP